MTPDSHPDLCPRQPVPGTDRGHIMIITPYYWPTLSASTHLMKTLAEGLRDDGWQVTVLTNGPGAGVPVGPEDPRLAGRIHRAANPFLRRLGVFAKLCEYMWFVGFFLLRGLLVRKVDITFVASTPPLAGLPAAMLTRLKGAKLVYNLQDIFPDSAVVAGMLSAEGLAYRWLKAAEESTYRVSDLVASISPAFSEHVQRLVPGTPVATIPNWVDTDEIRPMEGREHLEVAAFRQGGAFVVQYAGNIGFMQNLEEVVQAAARLKDDPAIRFVFIGDGNAKQSLLDLSQRLELTNCSFLPMQPLDRVPLVYNACDLGVIPLKAGAGRIAVPSKTWNYLAAGKPVIGCVEADSPLAVTLRESGAGSVVTPGDPDRLASLIRAYRAAPERGRLEGRQGRSYAETHLSHRIAIHSYIQMFDQLLGRPAHARAEAHAAITP
ncbi:MAG: hypothetical protein H6P99_210 [Holophagaceae bacterium]|nr:hypothetical protein [Holophagaceae bacterium]